MKLLKVGSSPVCDIILNSEYVSAHHADILVLDDGQIVIEDKGSSNGTFVGTSKKRLNPGVETPVRRGDLVRFADTDLVWARVPAPDNNSKYKTIINIGSNYRNELVLSSGVVSRFHATIKIDENGRAFIFDHKSKNGTQVNGMKIQSEKPVRIKRGDNVVCGDSDISEQIKEYIPNRFGWIKYCAAALACAVVVAGGILAYISYPWNNGPSDVPKDMEPSTVYVFAAYHFNITLEDNPVSIPLEFKYPANEKDDLILQATAFFIDREGHMATNRHVALPWNREYRTDSIHNVLKQAMENYMVAMIPKQIKNQYEFDQLSLSEYGRALINESKNLNDLNALISRVYKSKVIINGEMDYIAVGYPGKYFSSIDELERCNVICESGTADQDVAILQLNNKKTPDAIKYVFDVKNFRLDKLNPMAEDLYAIGYPSGLVRAMDIKTKSLTPSIITSKCSKTPSKYTFELQQDITGGSSGSPVFDNKGRLVGIVSGYYAGNGSASVAVQVRFLKELYDKEINAFK